MKILKWLIGFPLMCVFAYLIYAMVFGLIGSLICWDINVLINLVKFWSKPDHILGRALLWVFSIGVSLYFFTGGFNENYMP